MNEVLSPVLPLTAWVSMFYFMESAAILIFSLDLCTFRRECEKEYSLYACDNDEKDGRPLREPATVKIFVTSILIGMPPSEAPLKIDIQIYVALEAMGSNEVSAM
jgi:hypothetical protein